MSVWPAASHTRTPEGTGITAAPDASTTAAAKAGDTEAGIRTRGLPANSISNHRRWRWWANAIAGRCHQHARKAIDRRSQLPAPTIDQTRCHVVLTRYFAHHCAGRKPRRDDRSLRLAAPPAPTVTRHVEGLLDACADAPRDHVTGVADSAGIVTERWPYKRCGSIEIEAGRSLPTKIGRMMCDWKRHTWSSPSMHCASKSAIIAGGFIRSMGGGPSAR